MNASFHAGHAGERRAAGILVQSVYDPLDPMLQELLVHQQIQHEGILEVEPFEHEPDCLLPFDTESATNEVPFEHRLVDRLERPGPNAL
jgi:hypothetical protein